MKKRSLAMVLACIMAASCVAGCGQKKQDVAKGTFGENGEFEIENAAVFGKFLY